LLQGCGREFDPFSLDVIVPEAKTATSRSAAALASRLRLIQSEMADRSAAERQDYLTDEVRRATAQMLPDQQREIFDQLLEEFPSWGEVGEPAPPAAPAGIPLEQWNDPKALVEQLLLIASKDGARRREVLERIYRSGLVVFVLPAKAEETIKSKLPALPTQAKIDAWRAVEVLLMLMEFSRKLESFVSGTWSTVARGVGPASPKALGDLIARFLIASESSVLASLRQELEGAITLLERRARVFPATMRQFSQQHAEKFAPAEIESMVNAGFLANRNKVLWDKYVELCGGTDREHLESEVRQMQTAIIQRIFSTV
jgi:hypothetical protein